MRMAYWKCRLNAVWVEIYAEKAEDAFDATEMLKLVKKEMK